MDTSTVLTEFLGNIIGLLLIALFIKWLFSLLFRKSSKTEQVKGKSEISPVGYHVRDTVMNSSEGVFFSMLVKALPENYYVFPKMRIADIIETEGGYGYTYRRNKILPKHIDFLVCNSHFKPVIAIELDGKSHNKQNRIVRDEFVDKLFEDCKIKLLRVNVGGDFKFVIDSVIAKYCQ